MDPVKVNSLDDWLTTASSLMKEDLIGPAKTFALLIGPSAHSPVPKAVLHRVVEKVQTRVRLISPFSHLTRYSHHTTLTCT